MTAKLSPFSPFRFTDGESYMSTSDAQITDFSAKKSDVHFLPATKNSGKKSTAQILRATPETRVNTFGVVNFPFKNAPIRQVLKRYVAINPHNNGIRATAGAVHGSYATWSLLRPIDAIAKPRQDKLVSQQENFAPKIYKGQL